MLHFYLGIAYMQKAMYEEALNELKLDEGYMKAFAGPLIGIVNSRMGNKDRAYEIFNECTVLSNQKNRSKKIEVSIYVLAALCFSLREDDLGFELLEKAFEAHDTYMYMIKIDFLMERVRSDPRFVSICRRP